MSKQEIKPKAFKCYLDNYTMIEFLSDEEAGQFMMYGKYLPEHPTDAFREYLIWEARGLEDLLKSLSRQKTPAARARSGTLKKQLEENRRILEMIR